MWEQIRSNRIRSVVLVAGMAGLLLAIGYFLGEAFLGSPTGGIIIAAIVLLVMNLVAYFQGDNIMLRIAGARKINREDHPRLYNIVEEMKLASGLEYLPDVYIIDDPALNAFATGRDPKHAAVAITSGLLQKLNRDELQGVIAHEIAHIKNRDVLLMAFAGVLLGTIVMLSWYASRLMLFGGLYGGRRRSSAGGGQAQLLIMVVAIALAVLAPIFAYLIYFAISRRREFLADASAALYTRYPEGLASALEKLGASRLPVKRANQATAPMYIVHPMQARGRQAGSLMSTHPPIEERVRILRSMGGASLADYEQAYRSLHRGRGRLFSPRTVAAAGTPGLQAVERPRDTGEPSRLERAREVSDLMWRQANFRTVDCECGTRLRVPPEYRGDSVRCPHCGHVSRLQ